MPFAASKKIKMYVTSCFSRSSSLSGDMGMKFNCCLVGLIYSLWQLWTKCIRKDGRVCFHDLGRHLGKVQKKKKVGILEHPFKVEF